MWSHCQDVSLIWRRTWGRWSISGGVHGVSQAVEGEWGTDFNLIGRPLALLRSLLFGMRPTLTMGPNLFHAVSQLKCHFHQKHLIRTPKNQGTGLPVALIDLTDWYMTLKSKLSLFSYFLTIIHIKTQSWQMSLRRHPRISETHMISYCCSLFYRCLWVDSSKYYSTQLRMTWEESLNWRNF